VTIAQLVNEFVEEVEKNSPMRSSIRKTQLHLHYRTFVQAFGDELVSEITKEQIDSWLKPRARSDDRANLVSLFRFSVDHNYRDTNPAYSTPVQALKTSFLTSSKIP
jgi:hypothetical protein